jgi:hypothetical protein
MACVVRVAGAFVKRYGVPSRTLHLLQVFTGCVAAIFMPQPPLETLDNFRQAGSAAYRRISPQTGVTLKKVNFRLAFSVCPDYTFL